MGRRGLTLPPAATNSAKAFRSAFYCDLCSKGYSRQNEYDAHESSYDHQHTKRLKEMKNMQKQAAASAGAQSVGGRGKGEEKGPIVQIKLGSSSSKVGQGSGAGGTGGGKKGGFKKGGFKNAFGAVDDDGDGKGAEEDDDDDDDEEGEEEKERAKLDDEMSGVKKEEGRKDIGLDSSDVTDEEDDYDPRRPTGCLPGCKSRSRAAIGSG